MRNIYLNIIIFFIILVAGAGFVFYYDKPKVINDSIPFPQAYNTSSSSVVTPIISPSQSSIQNTKYEIPDTINLAVPFTSQAPHADWGLPYQEFCEEASVFMAAGYIQGFEIPSPDFADEKMLEIKSFEEQRFGYYKDTTAEETAVILREFYVIENVEVVYNPTVDRIKKALVDKKVVIAPAAGRQLGNPYFTQPGPIYHMLVIKGYTKEGNFITNDPGTRRGADFIYTPDILMNAIHDWNGGDVENGQKVVIIVG